MDSAKETAKETLHKVTHPSTEPSKNTQKPANTGLERDMEPKPRKFHLPSDGEDIVYTPSGKLAGKKALITGGDWHRPRCSYLVRHGGRYGGHYLPLVRRGGRIAY